MSSVNTMPGEQGLTLVHIFAQPEPFLSQKPAGTPPRGTKSTHVELKSGRVYAPAGEMVCTPTPAPSAFTSL